MALGTSPLVTTNTIKLDWDPETKRIKNPIQPTMNVGENVTVEGPYGKRAMIKFLSPFGEPIATVKDGDVFPLLVAAFTSSTAISMVKKQRVAGVLRYTPPTITGSFGKTLEVRNRLLSRVCWRNLDAAPARKRKSYSTFA